MAHFKDYSKKLTEAMNNLRKQDQLCDITINVSGRAFHAHKNVLAAFSSYFMAMFTSGFRESSQSEINIDGDPDIFEFLLDFAYTGKMNITMETACSVLEMASYMQFNHACESTAKFLKDEIAYNYYKPNKIVSITDVFKIYEVARLHDHLRDLGNFLEKILCKRLNELKTSEVFLQNASEVFMKLFLQCDDLSSEEEEKEVLRLVVSWLKHDWENRRPHAPSLLQGVRLGLVPKEILKELLDEEILAIPECKKLFKATCKGQKSKSSKQELSKKMPQLFCTRSTITAPLTLSPRETRGTHPSTFRFFHETDKKWKDLTMFGKMECKGFPRIDDMEFLPSFIVVNDVLYAVGGLDEEEQEYECLRARCACMFDDMYHEEDSEELEVYAKVKSDVREFDAVKNDWICLPNMNTKRQQALLVHLDGFIYAIGGGDDEGRQLCDVERYDIANVKWMTLASLPRDSYNWVSAVAWQGKILVSGVSKKLIKKGKEPVCYRKLVVQVYDPRLNSWQGKLNEKLIECGSLVMTHPVLFLHKDQWYRVYYKSRGSSKKNNPSKAFVNIMHISKKKGKITVGEEVAQDLIPANRRGAFRIENEVFFNINGFIYHTGLTIAADQTTNVNLGAWKDMNVPGQFGNITYFTFDKKKLGYRLV